MSDKDIQINIRDYDENNKDDRNDENNKDDRNDEDNGINNSINSYLPSDNPLYIKINKQVNSYRRLLKDLFNDSESSIYCLDNHYNNLQWYNTLIQTSVIVASSASTFMQSLLKDNEEFISTLTLCISTYSGLTLSLSKFFRLDERREKTASLNDKYVEYKTSINYQIDILKPWMDDEYYNNPDDNYYENEWYKLSVNLERDYARLSDIKKNLSSEYGKIIHINS